VEVDKEELNKRRFVRKFGAVLKQELKFNSIHNICFSSFA
jgi:hypothetical protein